MGNNIFKVSLKGCVLDDGRPIVRVMISDGNSNFSLDISPESGQRLGLGIINMSKQVQMASSTLQAASTLLGDADKAAELARLLTTGLPADGEILAIDEASEFVN